MGDQNLKNMEQYQDLLEQVEFKFDRANRTQSIDNYSNLDQSQTQYFFQSIPAQVNQNSQLMNSQNIQYTPVQGQQQYFEIKQAPIQQVKSLRQSSPNKSFVEVQLSPQHNIVASSQNIVYLQQPTQRVVSPRRSVQNLSPKRVQYLYNDPQSQFYEIQYSPKYSQKIVEQQLKSPVKYVSFSPEKKIQIVNQPVQVLQQSQPVQVIQQQPVQVQPVQVIQQQPVQIIRQENTQMILSLQDDFKRIQSDYEHLLIQYNLVREEVRMWRSRYDDLNLTCQEQEQKLKLKDIKIQELLNRNIPVEIDVSPYERRIQEKIGIIKNLEQRIQDLENENSQFSTEITEITEQYEIRYQKLIDESDLKYKAMCSSYETEIQQLKNKIADLNMKITVLTSENDQSHQRESKLETKIKTLTKQIEDLNESSLSQQKISNTKIRSLTDENDHLNEEVRKLQKQTSNLNNEVGILRNRADQNEKILKDKNQELIGHIKKVDDLGQNYTNSIIQNSETKRQSIIRTVTQRQSSFTNEDRIKLLQLQQQQNVNEVQSDSDEDSESQI